MKTELLEQWNLYARAAVSDADRQRLLSESVALDCFDTDPQMQCRGLEELTRYIELFQKNLPGGSFTTRKFQEHHDQALVDWDRVSGDGTVLSPGASVLRLSSDGRTKTAKAIAVNAHCGSAGIRAWASSPPR